MRTRNSRSCLGTVKLFQVMAASHAQGSTQERKMEKLSEPYYDRPTEPSQDTLPIDQLMKKAFVQKIRIWFISRVIKIWYLESL